MIRSLRSLSLTIALIGVALGGSLSTDAAPKAGSPTDFLSRQQKVQMKTQSKKSVATARKRYRQTMRLARQNAAIVADDQTIAPMYHIAAGHYNIAPGSIVKAFPAPAQGKFPSLNNGTYVAKTFPLPECLGGIKVFYNANNIAIKPAKLFHVCPEYILFQIPIDINPNDMNVFDFSYCNQSDGFAWGKPKNIKPVGFGALEILHFPSLKPVTKDPVSLSTTNGNIIVIYGTGLGTTTPKVNDGDPAPASPLAEANSKVSHRFVMYDDNKAPVELEVLYTGRAPAYAGLDQVNLRIPTSVANTSGTKSLYFCPANQIANCANLFDSKIGDVVVVK